MANDYEELDWTCPMCTLFNSFSTTSCSVCGYQNKNLKNELTKTTNKIKDFKITTNSRTSPTDNSAIDSNNNNSETKYTDMFKSAFSTLSNDVKNFISGLGNNANANSRYDYNDNPDVIEIDPKTNKPVKQSSSNKKSSPAQPKTASNRAQSYEQWACKACSFAANPEWNSSCEMCCVKRHDSKINSSDKKPSDPDLVVYDTSLNEDIYDYARIWTCKKCTYINFQKDEACELCLSPRGAEPNAKGTAPAPKTNEPRKSELYSRVDPAKVNSRWVCRKCTYFNTDGGEECALCSAARERSASKNGAKRVEWKCAICSHRNKSNTEKCEVCANGKEDQPMETDEKSAHANQYDNVSNNNNNNNNDDEDSDEVVYPKSSKSSRAGSSRNLSLTFRSQKAKSIIKTYTNVTSQAERVWNNIVRYCKEQQHKFVDDSFPPCDKSLFIDPSVKPDNLRMRGIQWLSPEHIRAHHDEHHLKWTVYNDPKFNDIKQGLLGNCWLLSGLAVIIEQPELLRKIIITKDFCPQGCYQVRLCHNGEWQTVIFFFIVILFRMGELKPCFFF